MKSAGRVIVMIVAAGLSLSASGGFPAESGGQRAQTQLSMPAERILDERLYDLSGSFFRFACSADGDPLPIDDGELIEMEGQIYERISFIVDGVGGQHFLLNTMPVGVRGRGVTSGEEFRVSQSQLGLTNSRLAGGSGTYRQELKMVGMETRRSFWLISQGNYTIAADGTTIVARGVERVECRI